MGRPDARKPAAAMASPKLLGRYLAAAALSAGARVAVPAAICCSSGFEPIIASSARLIVIVRSGLSAENPARLVSVPLLNSMTNAHPCPA